MTNPHQMALACGVFVFLGACNNQQFTPALPKATAEADSGAATPAAASSPTEGAQVAPGAFDPTPASAGWDQNGTGWGTADLKLASSSQTYKGLSLDAMLAIPTSLAAKEIGTNPELIKAIKVQGEKWRVPTGLIAADIIQESNANPDEKGGNDGYDAYPVDQRFDVGIMQAPLWKFPGATTAEKLKNSKDPYQNLDITLAEFSENYRKTGSWGAVLSIWYCGTFNPNDLSDTRGYSPGGEGYVVHVLGHQAMGQPAYD